MHFRVWGRFVVEDGKRIFKIFRAPTRRGPYHRYAELREPKIFFVNGLEVVEMVMKIGGHRLIRQDVEGKETLFFMATSYE